NGRGRHERRDDRIRTLHRGAGNRRRNPVQPRGTRLPARTCGRRHRRHRCVATRTDGVAAGTTPCRPFLTVQLVAASANPAKVPEIAAVLAAAGIEVLPRPADIPDVVEDADTLEGNARLKASAVCEGSGTAAVADDTGLEVDALDGAPGVYSARYAGED